MAKAAWICFFETPCKQLIHKWRVGLKLRALAHCKQRVAERNSARRQQLSLPQKHDERWKRSEHAHARACLRWRSSAASRELMLPTLPRPRPVSPDLPSGLIAMVSRLAKDMLDRHMLNFESSFLACSACTQQTKHRSNTTDQSHMSDRMMRLLTLACRLHFSRHQLQQLYWQQHCVCELQASAPVWKLTNAKRRSCKNSRTWQIVVVVAACSTTIQKRGIRPLCSSRRAIMNILLNQPSGRPA